MTDSQSHGRMKRSFSLSFCILFVLVIFCFLSFFASGNIDSEDGWLYLNVTRNIYYHHEILATPQTDYPQNNVNMNSVKGADGKWHTPAAVGYSLAMVPAVALSDLFHRYYHSPPANFFPLVSDWSLLFFASFTNTAFTSLLALIMLLYGTELGFSKRQSLSLSLITTFCTYVFSTSKFGFPQMMFTSFLMLTFLLIKIFTRNRRADTLVLCLASFGILASSYNVSYYLTILPLVLYFLWLQKPWVRWRYLKVFVILSLVFAILRFRFILSLLPVFRLYPKVVFEGVWGFLFSSGKSIFLYSPVLLLIPMFWHKFNKKFMPELAAFGMLALLFMVMIGGAWIGNPATKEPIWYGGMVWGPRYALPFIPGLTIIAFTIVLQLDRKLRRWIVYPLLIVGIGIQLVGASVIYLLQYPDLPYSVFIGKTEVSVYDYTSFIPRYTPLWAMPYAFARIARQFPDTIWHGRYDVRFYDGFDMPLYVGGKTIYRGFRQEGHIFLSQTTSHPIKSLRLFIENVPDASASSESAKLTIQSGGNTITTTSLVIGQGQSLNLTGDQLKFTHNLTSLDLFASYAATPSAAHVIYIKELKIDGNTINLGSLDYPDVSSMGEMTTSIPYQFYGGRMNEPWKLWDLRARINERTFDFWWIKNLYYWDRPQRTVWIIFFGDLAVFASALVLVVKFGKRELQ